MLHQQIRPTDLREKSYVYDSRGWDGGLCLIEWMDGWMELGYFKGELGRKERRKKNGEKKGENKLNAGGGRVLMNK